MDKRNRSYEDMPDYLAEALEFRDGYQKWLTELPAYVFANNEEQYRAELLRRDRAVDEALDRRYREERQALLGTEECFCDPRNPDAPACANCREQNTEKEIPY